MPIAMFIENATIGYLVLWFLVCVWIRLFLCFASTSRLNIVWTVHSSATFLILINFLAIFQSWDSQICFLNNFFIKNESHDTIYIFKNYFAIVFSVFSQINYMKLVFKWDFLKQLIKPSYKITILSLSPTITTGHRKTQPTQLTHKFEREARSCCWRSSSSEGVQNLDRKLNGWRAPWRPHQVGPQNWHFQTQALTPLLNLVFGWVNNNNCLN